MFDKLPKQLCCIGVVPDSNVSTMDGPNFMFDARETLNEGFTVIGMQNGELGVVGR